MAKVGVMYSEATRVTVGDVDVIIIATVIVILSMTTQRVKLSKSQNNVTVVNQYKVARSMNIIPSSMILTTHN